MGAAYRTMDWSYEKRQLGVVREMVRKGKRFSQFSVANLSLISFPLRDRSHFNPPSTNFIFSFITHSSC